MTPIDAVLPWVDGNDPVLAAKRNAYLGKKQARNEDIAGVTRYRAVGEIKYCIASILRFAPFIRNIYIITDGQNPNLNEFLDRHFPDRKDSVKIVDHSVIFRGYEQYLPTFNSNSIDTLIWNIPELSERFIYLNDDFFFIAPSKVEDFFIGDKVVCYGKWRSVNYKKYLSWLIPRYDLKKVGFPCFQYNGMKLICDDDKFISLRHSPRALYKSWFKEFIPSHQKAVHRNLAPKFRSAEQWEVQEAFYIDMFRKDLCILNSSQEIMLYAKGKPRRGRVQEKINKFEQAENPLYLCFNSLDQNRHEELPLFFSWIENRLGLTLTRQ